MSVCAAIVVLFASSQSYITPVKLLPARLLTFVSYCSSKKSAKTAKAAGGDKKKGRKGRRTESYNIYIYKVLKQVHPGKSLLDCRRLLLHYQQTRRHCRDGHLQEGHLHPELIRERHL